MSQNKFLKKAHERFYKFLSALQMRFYKEAGPSFHSTNSLLETETNKKSNTEKAKKFQN